MLKTFTNLLSWTDSNVQDEWNTWEDWQKQQPSSHYEKSDIFQYYLSYRPNFQPPRYSDMSVMADNKYYVYCFGDFASLLVTPRGGNNIVDYLTILLDVYDVCKGFTRRLSGDPASISVLREVISGRTTAPLQRYDFSPHIYSYNTIHGHTVAQYSLSTLLMRMLSHYMKHAKNDKKFFDIRLELCKESYENCLFGIPIVQTKVSQPVNIQQKNKITTVNLSTMDHRNKSFSWPKNQVICLRCKICSRVTENIWGNFDVCLDCHLKRICSECSGKAIIISSDGLPKCSLHQL
jgi:hypothetical protein